MKRKSVIPCFVHSSGSRIIVLSSTHFLADLLGCMLPGFLLYFLRFFHLNLGTGVLILSCMSIGCNLLQIPVALIDRRNRRPRMLFTGLFLSGLIVVLGILPDSTPTPVLCLLMLLVGTGIALVHPFGLRGVQNITDLAPTVTTPAFMTGGFFGSAVGPLLGALLVETFGLSGLLWMTIPIVLLLTAIILSNIKLARDRQPERKKEGEKIPEQTCTVDAESPWSFASLMGIALLLNIGTTTFQTLIPTHIQLTGLSSAAGGLSAMLFGAGSTVGSLTMGYLSKRRKVAPFVLWGMTAGVPMTAVYLYFSAHLWALPLVFLSGMLACSGFPMMVFLSRSAPGKLGLGSRMAWIVGGTWGMAGLAFLGIGQFASKFGVATVINASWISYFLALCTALILLRKKCA